MPNTKEKLIELLKDCPYRPKPNCMWELIADHLIANGKILYGLFFNVTVQEWISVKDRLPEEGMEVLALCWHHEAWQPHVCYLSTNFKGRWITSIAGQWMMNVTHWMPLPQPPKGE